MNISLVRTRSERSATWSLASTTRPMKEMIMSVAIAIEKVWCACRNCASNEVRSHNSTPSVSSASANIPPASSVITPAIISDSASVKSNGGFPPMTIVVSHQQAAGET